MKQFSLAIFFMLLFSQNGLFAQKADDVLGLWLTEEGKARVEIYKEGTYYNGKIVWLKEPMNPDGTPKLDLENSEAELQSRPIMGLDLVKGFTFEDGAWENGEIYDPESGKTYACRMKLKGDKLEVRGYLGMSMFGRTVVWNRVK